MEAFFIHPQGVFAVILLNAALSSGQSAAAGQTDAARPLPDLNTLMTTVEANERKSEAIQKNYIYNEKVHEDTLDSHDGVKKTKTTEREFFSVDGVPVARTVARDGKPLSASELKKEDDQIDSNVKKAKERRDKADQAGKETDARGHDELTFSRILELGSFANARRGTVDGRDTIVVDYTGNPKAKTHNYAEGVFRELNGTVWIDEQDKTLKRLEGHFEHDFKIGGGLMAEVKAGTWFKGNFRKVNDEVWFLQGFEGSGHARYLLFLHFNGHIAGEFSNFRKFKATSTIMPGLQKVAPEPDPAPTIPHP